MSTIEDIGVAIAARIRREREAKGWSLGDLAAQAGVSKAMLSKVERGEASPTAVILSRIAAAFGLTLAALVEQTTDQPRMLRARDQPVWRDPRTSYLRRQIFLSPANPLELVEIELSPRQQVSFPASVYLLVRHVVWVLSGELEITEGRDSHRLAAGDRLEFGAPIDTTFRNAGAQACRYVVAVLRIR